MATPPFKVKAVYEYTSPHDDDLNFPLGQVITVTEKEDDDWYIGEYIDSAGVKKDGLFPKNFVEKFEPEAPPRPSRTRPKKEALPAEPEAAAAQPEARDTEGPPQAPSIPPAAVAVKEEPASVVPSSPEAEATAAATEPPKPVAASKPPPPPVAEKSSSFKDRIAAFNKGSQAPVVPVKPTGAPSASSFIKKPFVPPPPSRDSYVPPPRKEPPPKVYRREEDPDIAEQRAQDAEQAEKAGLTTADPGAEGEEHIKATSLKDRIALLQKQQQEQAERHAEAAAEKSKRLPKRRPEAVEATQSTETVDEGNDESRISPDLPARQSTDSFREAPKPPPVRRSSREPRSGDQSRDMLSSDNDADQSGAGDTTEDAGGESTEVEDEPNIKPPTRTSTAGTASQAARAPSAADEKREPEEEEEDDDEEEQEEEDPEAKRKRELRERMAKMSGGMGMGNLFGPPGGTSTGSAKRTKGAPSASAEERSPPPPPQRIPIMPMPGVQKDDSQAQRNVSVEKEPEPSLPITSEHPPQEIPDVEDLEAHVAEETNRSAAPPVPQERPVPSAPSVPTRGAAPPVPGSRPVPPPPETRAVPPVPPRTDAAAADSAAEDEDEDDEDTAMPPQPPERDLPARPPPPPAPQGPRSPPPPPRRSTELMAEAGSPSSSPPASSQPRRVPPVPGVAPTMPPPSETRPPPPPPPTAAPPKLSVRDSTAGANEDDAEGGGDSDFVYEGDYDTDIASTAPKKDALKHVRDPSFDEGTFSEDASSPMQTPVPPPPTTRAAPPPPPHQAPKSSRQSMEASRSMPPAPPIRQPMGSPGDEDYDPYRYDTAPAAPGSLLQESDPKLYGATSPPMPNTRAVPPPPTSPPQQKHTAPPPPPPQHQTLPAPADMRPSREMSRKSAEAPRASLNPTRRSLEQSRTSGDFSEQIAQDVDLEPSTLWWTQPNAPPPIFQNRSDILFESEESSTSKRGGRTTISRDVYVLFQDYSQTIATAQFDSRNPSDVNLEQRHEAPPPRLRQEQLEEAHGQYGSAIAKAADSAQNNSVGNGSAQALVVELVRSIKPALLPVGNRAYGALVYSNMANATLSQHDEIRPGDIVSFRNAKFQGKAGALHKNYSMEVGKPDHVAIVKEWDGTKKKIRALEQGRDKEKKGVREESFRVGDLRSGEVKVWRVVGRDWVGWES